MAKLTINIGAKIDALKKGLSDSASAVKNWGGKFKRSNQSVQDEVKKTDKLFGKLTSKLRAPVSMKSIVAGFAGITAGIGAAIAKSVQLAAQFEQTRVAFNTMLGDSAKGGAMLDQLIEFSQKTPFTPEQTMKAGKALLAFGFDGKEVAGTMRILGDVSAGIGKDLTELAIIFGQIKNAGRLMGQDLKQLHTAGFNPLEVIAEKTGKSMGQLADEMSRGLISFKDVEQAFISVTSEGGKFFNMMEAQSKTLNGRLSTLKGSVSQLGVGVGNILLPAVKLTAEAMNGYADSATDVAQASKTLNDDTAGLKLVFAEYLDMLTLAPRKAIDAALGIKNMGEIAADTADKIQKAADAHRELNKQQKRQGLSPSIDVTQAAFPGMQRDLEEGVRQRENRARAARLGFEDTSAKILANIESFDPGPTQEEQEQQMRRQMAIERQDLADLRGKAQELQASIGAAFQPGGKVQSRLARIGGERTINVDAQIPRKQLEELQKINKAIDLQTDRISRLDFQIRFPED